MGRIGLQLDVERFNPRPRAGANTKVAFSELGPDVSIHAPARGRTKARIFLVPNSRFQSTPPRGANTSWEVFPIDSRFQSTPPRGGERPPEPGCPSPPRFNPRPRAGANPAIRCECPGVSVSIHAPARGRTPNSGRSRFQTMFQSTPPRGGEHADRAQYLAVVWFQSTPPRGGEHRSRRGPRGHGVSIHAPARGRTRTRAAPAGEVVRFDPRPRAGANPTTLPGPAAYSSFNPRPRAGANSGA